MRSGMTVPPKNPSWKVPMSNCDQKMATEEEMNRIPTCHNNAHIYIERTVMFRAGKMHWLAQTVHNVFCSLRPVGRLKPFVSPCSQSELS